ncbi:hypothetical protein [Asanoa siamensis]|uniref:PknH-like extracellular domain-containing protein n=1 Tax=Asanoa siamensis TaxID=926357 RepID=A0ABQ4D3U5_9ACTN|nr:hypothetical protein [Asanoa siamensis]GIF78209.1 hypothetical protein Asi02nite_77270 [Asanoa siamensis]
MPELQDLMDEVRSDLTAVRLPRGADVRRRVRRRRQRTFAAVVLVTVVAAGAVGLARPDPEPQPVPAVSPTAGPSVIPRSALLRPEDVGAGPDTQTDGEDAFQPLRFEVMLESCLRERAPALLALRSRHSHRQTLLLGTARDRPAQPVVLGQAAYRLADAPQAAAVLRDLRAATTYCEGFTRTGEREVSGRTVAAQGRYGWPIVASGFAGDDSILVRHDAITRNADTGEVIGESSVLSAYVQVGDLVTVLEPRAGTSVAELRRIASSAAQRLCPAAAPRC